MSETVIARASRTFGAPRLAREFGRKNALLRVTAEATLLQGNEHPHFSVTAEAWTPNGRGEHGDRVFCAGCMHDTAAEYWPAVVPIIRLHLANSDDGEPMHGVANGWYWLAGALPGFAGERYCGATGSNARTPERCLEILAEHLRITLADAQAIRDLCAAVWPPSQRSPEVNGFRRHARKARLLFAAFVESQRARWKAEAQAGVALIKKLSAA